MFIPNNNGLPMLIETIGEVLKLANNMSKDEEKSNTPAPVQQSIVPVEVPRYQGTVDTVSKKEPININLTFNVYLDGKEISSIKKEISNLTDK